MEFKRFGTPSSSTAVMGLALVTLALTAPKSAEAQDQHIPDHIAPDLVKIEHDEEDLGDPVKREQLRINIMSFLRLSPEDVLYFMSPQDISIATEGEMTNVGKIDILVGLDGEALTLYFRKHYGKYYFALDSRLLHGSDFSPNNPDVLNHYEACELANSHRSNSD